MLRLVANTWVEADGIEVELNGEVIGFVDWVLKVVDVDESVLAVAAVTGLLVAGVVL